MYESPLSPALRDLRKDGMRDSREDLRRDEISELRFEAASGGETGDDDDDVGDDMDPWDAMDALAHNKKMAVWNLSKRRVAQRHAAVQEERPSLTTLKTDAMLLRNAAIPHAIWTLGDGSQGQCGHGGGGPRSFPPA